MAPVLASALLALMLAATGAAGAHSALAPPSSDTPDVYYGAVAVADLLTRQLGPINGTVYVDAEPRWSGRLLSALPPDLPRALVDSRLFATCRLPRADVLTSYIVVIARERSEDFANTMVRISIPPYLWLLLVTRDTSKSMEELIQVGSPMCHGETGMVTVMQDGAASLTVMTRGYCSTIVIDRWSPSPGPGRWRHGALPFWKTSRCPDGQPLRAADMNPDLTDSASGELLRVVARLVGLTTTVSNDSFEDVTACRADVVVFSVPFLIGPVGDLDPFFPTRLYKVVLAVPAGLRGRGALRALTAEFPPEMWAATLLGVLAVGAALAYSQGRPLTALLRALAPLLGSAPPGDSRHPVMGSWLLVSVVVTAAYQGLLLKMLLLSAEDVQSLQEVEALGLPIHASPMMFRTETFGAMRIVPVGTMQEDLKRVAQDRDHGLVLLEKDVPNWLKRTGRLHLLPLPAQTLLTQHIAARRVVGLSERLRMALARVAAVGLFVHWARREHGRLEERPLEPWPRPIVLRDLGPAFILLAAGLSLAAIALVAEILAARVRCGRGSGAACQPPAPAPRPRHHLRSRRPGGAPIRAWLE